MWEELWNFDVYNEWPKPIKKNQENQNIENQLSDFDKNYIDAIINKNIDNVSDKLFNWLLLHFQWRENQLTKYLNNYDFSKSTDIADDVSQIAIIKEEVKTQLTWLNNNIKDNLDYNRTVRVDHRELNDQLPQSTSIKVSKAYYYHEWIWPDHSRKLTRVDYSQELRNGLQQWEKWQIKLSDWKYNYNVTVEYQWDWIAITYWRYSEYIILNNNQRDKPLNLVLGNEVNNGRNWTYLKIQLRLNWR
jgi:hypothetical protein